MAINLGVQMVASPWHNKSENENPPQGISDRYLSRLRNGIGTRRSTSRRVPLGGLWMNPGTIPCVGYESGTSAKADGDSKSFHLLSSAENGSPITCSSVSGILGSGGYSLCRRSTEKSGQCGLGRPTGSSDPMDGCRARICCSTEIITDGDTCGTEGSREDGLFTMGVVKALPTRKDSVMMGEWIQRDLDHLDQRSL